MMVKSRLSRDRVPCTPSQGYALPLDSCENTLQLNAAWRTGCQLTAARQQPARGTKRKQRISSAEQKECMPGLPPCNSQETTPEQLAAWICRLHSEPLEAANAHSPWLQLNNVNLTRECIASTSLVRVMKAYHGEQMLAMKVFDVSNCAATESFVNELKAYNALRTLQGQAIPALHSFGRMCHTGSPALITCWAGCSLQATRHLSPHLFASAKEGLLTMHSMHVSHGDVRLSNMLLMQDRVVYCDFAQSNTSATHAERRQDIAMLSELYD